MRPQFGSAPKRAVFTSGETAMALLMSRAIAALGGLADLHGEELGGALPVGGDVPGQLAAQTSVSAAQKLS